MALYKGSTKVGDLYKGQIKVSDLYKGNNPIYKSEPAIAANTLRFEFGDSSYDPNVASVGNSGTWTKRNDYDTNVWDWTNSNNSWATAFGSGNSSTPGAFADFENNPVRVIRCGDLSNVTNMSRLFQNCYGISEILNLDTHSVTNVYLVFSHCENAEKLPDLNLTSCTEARGIFQYCKKLKSAPSLIMPNNITSFQNLFYYCSDLEEITLDFNNKASSLANIFYYCSKLKSAYLYNTTGSTLAAQMFYHCENLESINLFDTGNVTDMKSMFAYCFKLESIPLFDTHNVTKMPEMLRECYLLKHIPLFDTSKVQDFGHFAHRCYNLEDFPEFNTSSATEMNRIASCCPKLTSFPLLNTHNVTDFGSMLSGHSSSYGTEYPMHLTSIPAFDYSSATSLEDAFGNNLSLETIPQINAPNVQDVSNIFMNCSNVKQGAKQLYDTFSSQQSVQTYENAFKNCGINTDTGFTELEQIPPSWGGMKPDANTLRFEFSDTSYSPQTAGAGSSGAWTKRNEYGSSRNVWDWTRGGSSWSNSFYHSIGDFVDPNNKVSIIGCGDLSAVTNMSYMFTGCSSLVNIASIDTSHATNVSGIFSGIGCTQLPDLDFSSVTYAEGAFVRCENLVTAPNITFPTGHYFTANTMLSKCFSLVSLPLYNFTYCTSMDEFATHCHNLVNVPALNTSNVTSMREAFKNTAITSIPALNYSSVTDTYCMFSGCTSLTTITPINAPRITYAQSMFDGCTNVSSGALDMYNYLLDKVITSQAYENVFLNCGINTDTGFTELEQIPTSWGGKQPNSRTIRFEFGDTDYDPTVAGVGSTGTWTKRDDYDANVWDWYKNTSAMNRVFGSDTDGVDGAFNDIENNPVTIRCTGPMTGVINMYGMFQRCTGLYSVKHFDTSSVSTSGIAYMFSRCTNCTHYPTLDLSHCNNISYLFHYNEHLVHAPNLIMPSDSEFSATYLFCYCYLLESVPLYNLSQCTNLTEAFYCCYRLASLPAFNTQKVTTFSSALRDTSITEMPDWDYSKTTSIAYFMYGCYNVTRLRPILNNTALTNVNGAFEYCSAVEQGLYDCYASLLNINTITDHKATFIHCGARTETGKADIQRVHLDWGGRQNVPAIANNTLRFRFGTTTVDPASLNIGKGNGTWQRRTEYTDNVWDWTLTGTMRNAFSSTSTSGVADIIESGSWSGTLDMYSTFYAFQSLYSVCDLDFSNTTITDIRYAFGFTYNGLKYVGILKLPSSVTNIYGLYSYAYNLGYFPDMVVESLTNVSYAFRSNRRIMKGIYDMYEKLSECNPDETTGCFIDCGINGPSASELDLIPTTWGGKRPVLGYTPVTDDPEEPIEIIP